MKNKFILGCVFINFYSENKFNKNVKNILKSRNCILQIFKPYTFGYISTLGVIDEFRKIGLGKILINKSIEIMNLKKNCMGLFLHVVEYNKSAINFYIQNNFLESDMLQNHYVINDAMFNARVFYKFLKNSQFYIKINSANIPEESSTLISEDEESCNTHSKNKSNIAKKGCLNFLYESVDKFRKFYQVKDKK